MENTRSDIVAQGNKFKKFVVFIDYEDDIAWKSFNTLEEAKKYLNEHAGYAFREAEPAFALFEVIKYNVKKEKDELDV